MRDGGKCKCGCDEDVEGRMQYRPRHRQRAYRKRVREAMESAGLPVAPSLHVAQGSTPTAGRNGDGSSPAPARVRKPEVRIAYSKLLEVWLDGLDPAWTNRYLGDERDLRELLDPILTDKQRKALDER